HDGVLKDAVVEENDSRAANARHLIDKVKRKGHEASSKRIAHLKSVDNTLYCELGLSNVQPNRVALLITNIKFSEKSMNRLGAEKGEENMEKLPSNLGYEVVKYTNLTGKAIDEALIDFTKHPKLKNTLTACLWLSCLIETRGKLLGCPELIDKPKVIIIQACKGERRGSVLVNDSPNTAAHKNFISLLSCTPDTVSYRQPDRGSLLIQNIVEVFSPESYQEDICGLFEKIEMATRHYFFWWTKDVKHYWKHTDKAFLPLNRNQR
uniref:Caspase family p20 domain-containing protein n=1 Tax=Xiphophorus maculatus TaxID=8083 RepID=A0A3B5RDJ7_XIPMA